MQSISELGKNKKQHLQAIYRDLEFNVIPIRSDTKKPAEDWKPWQAERVPVNTLVRWSGGNFIGDNGAWKFTGCLNWAVLTGAKPWTSIPGIVVLDADDVAAMKLVEQNCTATELKTSTPGGGMHYIYRHPGIRIPNRQKTTLAGIEFNLDVRGDGGYVLCPGSIHAKNNKSYCARQPWTEEHLNAVPVYSPEWLPVKSVGEGSLKISHTEAITSIPDPIDYRTRCARRWMDRQPGAIQGRAADKYAYALAVKLVWGFCIPVEDATEIMVEWGFREDQATTEGDYFPWNSSQISHKVNDAANAHYTDPGNIYREEISLDLGDEFYSTLERLRR